jgi:hypothetical protein
MPHPGGAWEIASRVTIILRDALIRPMGMRMFDMRPVLSAPQATNAPSSALAGSTISIIELQLEVRIR